MRWIFLIVAMSFLCSGCVASEHAEAPLCDCKCPATPPDPIPCIRQGQAMAGHADHLLDTLAEGDSTQIDAAADSLGLLVDTFEGCSIDLVVELLGN